MDVKGTPSGRKALSPALSALGTLMIVLSAVTPASSVFIIVPGVIALAGTGALLSFVVAAVVALFMAFVYAELSSAYPTAGGEYTMVGRTLGRFWGFIAFALVFVSLVLIIAVIALGVGAYLGVLLPDLDARYVAVAVIASATVVAVLHVKVNALVTGLFLAVELLALVVLAVLGFAQVERPLSSLLTQPVMWDAAGQQLLPASAGLILAATAVALFAYNGYGSAAFFGEETHDAKRNIGRVVVWALVITVIAEAVPLTAVLMGAPDLEALFKAPQKIEYFLEARAGHGATVAISLAIALAIFNAVIAIVLQAARLLFSSARDGTWLPAVNRLLSTVHGRHGSPWAATVVVSVMGAAACFINLNQLFVVTGTTLVLIYLLLCVAVIAGRRHGSTDKGHYRMPGYPLPAVLALLSLTYIVYQNVMDPDFGQPSLLATGLICVAAALYYKLMLARRKDWTLHGPEELGG